MQRRGFLLSACASALRIRAADGGLGTIVYSQPDGLWVRSLPDGRPRKVAASGKTPRFSPSGEWVSFEGGVIRSDGTASAPLPSGTSIWLPRQDILAIATEDGFGLFSPGNAWTAPFATRKGVGIPVFNDDGSKFAYSKTVGAGRGPGGEPMRNGELCRATMGGTESRTLLARHLVLPIPYAWTRDSTFIVYWEDPDFSASVLADGLALFRAPVDGGSPKPLGVITLVHGDLLSLSPTENKLAVTAGGGREIYEGKRIAIVDLDIDKGAVRFVTGDNTSAMAPSWSPDGRRIAYVQAPAPPPLNDNLTARPYVAQRRIWVADASAAAPSRPITGDSRYRDEEPLWSADGTHILFCRLNASGVGTLWLMDAGGGDPIPVSDALALKNLSGLYGYGFYGYINWRGAFDWHRL